MGQDAYAGLQACVHTFLTMRVHLDIETQLQNHIPHSN